MVNFELFGLALNIMLIVRLFARDAFWRRELCCPYGLDLKPGYYAWQGSGKPPHATYEL